MNPDAIKKKIAELKREYEAGQSQLRQLEDRINNLKQTMFRISGAIQVLEELLQEKEK
jgi:septal ring factor EnvC (AmiA/AmiB activator)